MALSDRAFHPELGSELGECRAMFAFLFSQIAGVGIGDILLDINQFFTPELGDDEPKPPDARLERHQPDAQRRSMQIGWKLLVAEQSHPMRGVP